MRMDRQLWKILQFSWVYSYNSCMCASCLWRLIEYHTPVCLVGACLKPQRRNSAAFHDFSSRIPRNRRLGRSALYLILFIFFLPLTWNLHVFWFIGAQNFMEPIQILPEVYGRKITKLWRTVVRGSDQMCSLFSLQPKVSHMSQALEGQWTKTSDWQGKEGWLVLDTVGDTRAWGMFLNSASCISLALVFMRGSVQIGCSARLAQRSALVVSLRQ